MNLTDDAISRLHALADAIGRCPKDCDPLFRREHRVRAWAHALDASVCVEDAAMLLHDDNDARAWRLGKIAGGDTARVAKEFQFTPVMDLRTARWITASTEVNACGGVASGFALTVYRRPDGEYTTGDFRHELGHVVFNEAKMRPIGGSAIVNATTQAFDAARAHRFAAGFIIDAKGEAGLFAKLGAPSLRALDNVDEWAAEHYRCYHRELLRQRKKGGDFLAVYRAAAPAMARVWDARYTAALAFQRGLL